MSFYSLKFLLFLLFVCTTAFLTRGRVRKAVLLTASIVFYAIAQLSAVVFFAVSIIVAYFCSLWIDKTRSRASVAVSTVLILLPLSVFKYLPAVGGLLGFSPLLSGLVLPVGISFYTLQTVGYFTDIYRKKVAAERDFIDCALFISFFPQIMSGPIGRAETLMPQLKNAPDFDYGNSAEGLRTMALGFLYKVFIADTLGYVVDTAYDGTKASGLFLILATALFGLQIYCDFHGYTLMARGVAKVMGIDLAENFDHPYLSASVTDFWRRWHISLSSWFRDYVYIPLGGNRSGKARTYINIMIIFALSGIWHGAGASFVVWGMLNGVYLVLEKMLGLHRKKTGLKAVFGRMYTYILICLAWVFFRADSIGSAFGILKKMFGGLLSGVLLPTNGLFLWKLAMSVAGIAIMLFIALYENRHGAVTRRVAAMKPFARWAVYIGCMALVMCFGAFGSPTEFIYFRF